MGTTSRPSGLASAEASFATNFVGATPTEQVTPCSSAMVSRSAAAMSAGEPSRRWAGATSRKASSRESGSTYSVTEPKVAMTEAEIRAYRRWSGATTTAWGQSRRARAIGIAEVTPKARAS